MQKYDGTYLKEEHLHICKCILFVAYMNKLIPGRGCGLPPSPPPPIPSRGLGEGGVGSEKISKFSFQVHI